MSYEHARTEDTDYRAGFALLMLVAGALVGAAAALMLAPTSGQEARTYIGRRGRAFADDVTSAGKKMWEEHGSRIATAVRREYDRATGSTTESGHHPMEPSHGGVELGKPM
jgi:gas vesicle protein